MISGMATTTSFTFGKLNFHYLVTAVFAGDRGKRTAFGPNARINRSAGKASDAVHGNGAGFREALPKGAHGWKCSRGPGWAIASCRLSRLLLSNRVGSAWKLNPRALNECGSDAAFPERRECGATVTPVPVENQIRTYWSCSPPRIGRQRICPARSTARENGASFSKERCVRAPLYNTTTERPRDRAVRASLSVASLSRMPGPYS